VSIGSLDDPSKAKIERQYGVESKIEWVQFCEDVPAEVTTDDPSNGFLLSHLKNNQSKVP
jgi:hypothetical protein